MLDFKPLKIEQKGEYDKILQHKTRGCAHSFVNLYLWGRQKAMVHEGNVAVFSQWGGRSMYMFPAGENVQPTLKALMADAKERGIPFRLTGMVADDCALLESLYPGQFRYHTDRDHFDYVYAVEDLAELKGRKYQRKRNHLNRFWQEHPECKAVPMTVDMLPQVTELVLAWYENRLAADPTADFHMEKAAIKKALEHFEELGMEGMVLVENGQLLAMTMGSKIFRDTFDVNFEKALDPAAYPAINNSFAKYMQQLHPEVRFLNREDDMGLEGLRKAKLSYCPEQLLEKTWACLLEDGCDY